MRKNYIKFIGISVLVIGVIVSIESFVLSHQSVFSPINSHIDIFDKVLPLLEEHRNTYTIYSTPHIVPQAQAEAEYTDASAYALVDFQSGEVLQEKNLSHTLPIASLTKIMTATVALDLLSPEELLTVSKHASEIEPTRAGFLPNEQLTTTEALHALLMTSANDAAEVLKENVDRKYGGDVFIKAMNAKAAFLGLKETHFQNPQGYDDSTHLSSVHDLAILTHYAISTYPLISQIVRKDFIQLPANKYHKQFDLYNWNGLLDVYPSTTGVKIGNTDAAQKTTIVLSNRGNRQLLAIVLGAPTIPDRDLWAAELLDEGYAKTLGLPPIGVTRTMLSEKYATWKYWN